MANRIAGRGANPNAKLTEQTIEALRLGRVAGLSVASLARQFSISRRQVARILAGEAWAAPAALADLPAMHEIAEALDSDAAGYFEAHPGENGSTLNEAYMTWLNNWFDEHGVTVKDHAHHIFAHGCWQQFTKAKDAEVRGIAKATQQV